MAEWGGILYAPTYGRYTLGVEGPGRVELILDGVKLEGEGSLDLEQLLAKGNHDLRLRAVGGQSREREIIPSMYLRPNYLSP